MISMKKCLFLDIDGVLNRAEYGKDLYEDTYANYCLCLHRPSIEALKKLLDKEPHLKIVWISDWAKARHEAHSSNECYLNPLYALEQFSWLKERVFGNIFSGEHENANGDNKLLAIKSFVETHMVESYVVVDDDTYEKTIDVEDIFNHIVHINPLKSLLEDDLPLIDKMLVRPMSGELMHIILMRLSHLDSFTVNNKYRCRFDYAKYYDKTAPLFTEFKKDDNCPRLSADVDVLVYDTVNGINLQGLLTLNIDKDLDNRKEACLYVKNINDINWTSGSNVIHLTDIVQCE